MSDEAALAANWRTVLLVDAALGLAAVVAGALVALKVQPLVGALVGAGGAAYLGLVARRLARWRRRRADAGL